MAGGDGGGPLGLLLSVTILVLIGILAFSIRLFSVSWDLPPSRLHGFVFPFIFFLLVFCSRQNLLIVLMFSLERAS
jgi:hypothetical protein